MAENKSYIERTLEFHKIFNSEILPLFRKEEINRLGECKSIFQYRCVVIFLLISVLIMGIVIGNAINPDKDSHLSIIFPMMFTLLFSGTIIGVAFSYDCLKLKTEKEYQTDLKSNFLNRILTVFGNIKWVNDQNIISDVELAASGLFPTFVERRVDDEFIGSYKGVDFKISENKLFLDMDTSKKERLLPRPEWQAFFKGCILVFSMNKPVYNRTIIATKNSLTVKHNSVVLSLKLFAALLVVLFPGIATGFSTSWHLWQAFIGVPILIFLLAIAFIVVKEHITNKNNLDKMNLEDLKFNDLFVSYSTSQVEGRYLVTPAFMERLLNLKTAFGTKNVKCSFYNDRLMIAIETNKDLFEIGEMHKSLNDNKLANKMYDQISSIYHLIDYFKLDQNIGL